MNKNTTPFRELIGRRVYDLILQANKLLCYYFMKSGRRRRQRDDIIHSRANDMGLRLVSVLPPQNPQGWCTGAQIDGVHTEFISQQRNTTWGNHCFIAGNMQTGPLFQRETLPQPSSFLPANTILRNGQVKINQGLALLANPASHKWAQGTPEGVLPTMI